MSDPTDDITPGTEEAEEIDAHAAHVPDRAPTPEEERLAERNRLDPGIAEHYEEMIEKGANIKGEGSVE